MKIYCDVKDCCAEIKPYEGALMFGAPDDDRCCVKLHLCPICYEDILINKIGVDR
jgi:hypothetical protein